MEKSLLYKLVEHNNKEGVKVNEWLNWVFQNVLISWPERNICLCFLLHNWEWTQFATLICNVINVYKCICTDKMYTSNIIWIDELHVKSVFSTWVPSLFCFSPRKYFKHVHTTKHGLMPLGRSRCDGDINSPHDWKKSRRSLIAWIFRKKTVKQTLLQCIFALFWSFMPCFFCRLQRHKHDMNHDAKCWCLGKKYSGDPVSYPKADLWSAERITGLWKESRLIRKSEGCKMYM